MKIKVTNKEELIKRIIEQQEQFAFYGVTNIGLLRSFVRGEQTTLSDIDILIEFAPEKHTFDNFMDVSFLLEDILGRKIDVVTPEGLSPHIGPHILKEVELVPIVA
ncbi:MAG: nucleotidyltransferase family protein [Desulfatiglans sp.]|jgi:predicted nucleotidyltransferase|nr:nucleotidyltransferase family protein [Desulfatiglans sp.]